jgi:hypothetical protein
MPGAVDLNLSVRNALIAVLPNGIRVQVEPRLSRTVPLFEVRVRAGSAEHHFIAGWAGEGWPADVERLLILAPELEVAFGKRFSRGAKEKLSAEHRGWVDESGEANVNLKTGLVIVREGRTPQAASEMSVRWTATMLAAAEAALAGITPTVQAVEKATGMSRGAATNALFRLEKLNLVERTQGSRGPGSARHIVDPDALLDAYAIAAASLRIKKHVVRVHRLWNDPLLTFETEIARTLDRTASAWAVSGGAASILLAPYLSDVTVVELYVDDDLFANRDQLAGALGGKAVDRGHVIEVRALPTRMSSMGPILHGIHVALPARVYADLLAAGGRSEEAAQHLRETVNVRPPSQ